MKIAQFKELKYGPTIVIELPAYTDDAESYEIEGFVRCSEWLEANFTPRSPEDVVRRMSAELKDIDDRKAELLA